jgi:hypothetical protein
MASVVCSRVLPDGLNCLTLMSNKLALSSLLCLNCLDLLFLYKAASVAELCRSIAPTCLFDVTCERRSRRRRLRRQQRGLLRIQYHAGPTNPPRGASCWSCCLVSLSLPTPSLLAFDCPSRRSGLPWHLPFNPAAIIGWCIGLGLVYYKIIRPRPQVRRTSSERPPSKR